MVDILVPANGQNVKFNFCDPSRGRRKRNQTTRKLDGFIHYSFKPVEVESPAAVSVNHGDAAIIVESASTSNAKDKPRAKEDHSFQVGSQSNVETVEVRSEQPSSLVVDHHDGVQVWLGHDDSESESQLADHPAAVAQAATAPTVRVESESEQDLDLMEFINWPEDQI
ncbi:hypothetical protein EV424DRAFT_1356766 [Suillus variegatus]|nr:hypothetical protein EV424DRAFT_1356766 [Suillus variegatus]